MATKFTLDEADKYEGARGPSRRMLCSQDGLVAAKIESITEKGMSSNNNLMLTVRLGTVDDDPGMSNVVLFSNLVVTGTNSRGNKNVQQLFTFMESAGSTKQQIIASVGKSVDADDLNKTYSGRTCYVQVRAKTYNGKESSEVAGFILQDAFEQEAKAGNHRQNHVFGKGSASAISPNNGAASAISPIAAPVGSSSDLSL